MSTRSKRLWDDGNLAATFELLYTCPAGKTALIKHLRCSNYSAAARTFDLAMASNGAGLLAYYEPVPALRTLALDTWIVLGPGETIYGRASAAGALELLGFGAELLGVA